MADGESDLSGCIRLWDLPTGLQNRLLNSGLNTAEKILKATKAGLREAGIRGADLSVVTERVRRETGQKVL